MVKERFISLVESVKYKYGLTYEQLSIALKKRKSFLTELKSKKSNNDVPDAVVELLLLKYPLDNTSYKTEGNTFILAEPEQEYGINIDSLISTIKTQAETILLQQKMISQLSSQ